MPRITIVTHPLCPKAQRLVLVASANEWARPTDYSVTYLPYPTLRESASRYSPDGALPVLLVDDVVRSTSTMHMAEYIDRRSQGRMLPSDPDELLTVRRREIMADGALDALRPVFMARDSEGLALAQTGFFDHIKRIDAELAADGTDERVMRMDMAAIAPVASLAMFFPAFATLPAWDATPRFRDMARRIVALPAISQSCCPDYGAEFDAFFAMTGSCFSSLMTQSQP
jgi:glutathione S-transferase